MGASQSMISRTMTVITRIIARVLGPVSDTVEEAPRGGLRIIDGMPLPCWSWKDPPGLFSGKYKCTGVNLQVMVGLNGRLPWACDPLSGSTHDAKATRHFRTAGRNRPLLLHRR